VLKSTTGQVGQNDRVTHTYVITLRASKGTVPVEIRLRQLLKIALRAFNLRAVDVREIMVSDKRSDKQITAKSVTVDNKTTYEQSETDTTSVGGEK
jgi:hypothetical protein